VLQGAVSASSIATARFGLSSFVAYPSEQQRDGNVARGSA
jgi:hypothetical protein